MRATAEGAAEVTPSAHASAARSLIAAARRALERGDLDEFSRLFAEADAQLVLMIEALPK